MTFEERRQQLCAFVDSWTDDERNRARLAVEDEQDGIRGEQAVHGLVHALWRLHDGRRE